MAAGTPPLAWLRINAYGILFVGLLLLSTADILDPTNSEIASVVGRVPVLQPMWTYGYVAAGLLILWGLFRSRSGPEFLGLGIVMTALSVQTVVGIVLTDADVRDAVVWLLMAGVTWLRVSALRSPGGLTVTIPGRKGCD